MVYHLKALHNHFISCHRKYSSQNSPIPTAHDGKVGDNTEYYVMALLYSDWLYILWHGIDACSLHLKQLKCTMKQVAKLNSVKTCCSISLPDVFSVYSLLSKKFLTLPDLDSFSAGLTCIAFCICDEKQNKTCNYPVYSKVQSLVQSFKRWSKFGELSFNQPFPPSTYYRVVFK